MSYHSHQADSGGGCCGCIITILAIIGLLYLVGCLPR